MAIDFNKPTVTDNYSTVFVPNLIANQIGLAQWLDSVQTSVSNPPTYGKRYNRTTSNFEEWNGSAWVQLPFQGVRSDSTGVNIGVGVAASATARLTVAAAAGNAGNPSVVFHNGTNNLWLTPATAGFNGMVVAGDSTLIFNAGTIDTGALVIGPYSGSAKGMRMVSDGSATFVSTAGFPLTVGAASVTGGMYSRVLTSTSELLVGQSGGTVLGFTTGTAGLVIQNGTVPLAMGTLGAYDLVLGTSNTERVRISSAGNFTYTGGAAGTFLLNTSGTGIFLTLTSSSSGSGTVEVVNITNAVDADFNIKLSQVGAATKVVSMGPATNITFNLQTAAATRMSLSASTVTLFVPLYGQAAASTTGATADGTIIVWNNGGTGDSNVAALGFICSGTYGVKLHLRADGVFGLGGHSSAAWRWYSDASGNMVASGNVTAYSDERRKRDWAELPDNFIERLAGVRMGTYTRIDSGERQVGVGAQSLRPLLPEAVTTGQDGDTLTLAYGQAALASAVALARAHQGLLARVEALEAA